MSNENYREPQVGRNGCLKVFAVGGASLLVLATGFNMVLSADPDQQVLAGNDETAVNSNTDFRPISTEGSIVIPDKFRNLRQVGGVDLYREFIGNNPGFATFAVIHLDQGAKLIPAFSSSRNNWFDSWSLTDFHEAHPEAEAIFTGSFFGIQDGKNRRVRNSEVEVQLNYPQKSEGKIVTNGWASNENYKGLWKMLLISGSKAKIFQLPGKQTRDFAGVALNDELIHTVITGLSTEAGKDRKQEVARTMLSVVNGGTTIVLYTGYGKQQEVVDNFCRLGGVTEDQILMLDGASSATVGYKDPEKPDKKFTTVVDAARGIPMVLLATP